MKNAVKLYATGLTIKDTQTKDLTVIFTYYLTVALEAKIRGQNHPLSCLSKSLFSSLDFGSLTATFVRKIFITKSNC